MFNNLPVNPSEYQIWRHIGSSPYSKIFLARCIPNNQLVAIKEYDFEACDLSSSRIIHEISLWSTIDHPNAVKYYQSFTFGTKVWILSECVNDGSLLDILKDYYPNGLIDEDLISSILYKVLLFLDYFHSNHHIHRNLKTNKILLSTDGEIKVTSFFFSRSLIFSGSKCEKFHSHLPFNKYAPLEMSNTDNFRGHDQSADIWNLGIIAIEIATGKTPFDDINSFEQMKQKINDFGISAFIPNEISRNFKNFISKCLKINQRERLTAHQLLHHNFIQKAHDSKYIEKVLTSQFLPLVQRYKFNHDELNKERIDRQTIKYEFSFTEDSEDFFSLDEFILQDFIGCGSFGKVFKVKSKRDGKIYAAKISIKSFENDSHKEIKDILREVNIISKINHPSILKFVFYNPFNFKEKPKPVIITEYAVNQSLDKILNNNKNVLDDTRKLIIIYGIVAAMTYLHSNKILHRDLKPANILLDELLFPKIADFGYSKVNHSKFESLTLRSAIGEIKGTPIYMAPEIWTRGEYSEASDVYAFGIVLYEIITNDKPYEHLNFYELYCKIREGYRPLFKTKINDSFKKLIESCWSQNPTERPSFNDILKGLQNDKGYISNNVNKKTYFDYIKYINGSNITFNSEKNILNLRSNSLNIEFSTIINEYHSILYDLYPYKEFIKLNEKCKLLVKESYENATNQFLIGKALIEGIDQFPRNVLLGIKFLKKAFINGCIDSIIYYCRMLIKGDSICQNLNKAKKLIQNEIKNKSMEFLLQGKISKKEKNYLRAIDFFESSLKLGNGESMYEYAKLLYKGIKASENYKEEAIQYFMKSIKFNYFKAWFKYGLILMKEKDSFEKAVDYIKMAADLGYSKAMYHYYSLMIEKNENDINLLKYLKGAAEKGHVEAIYKYTQLIADNQKELDEMIQLLRNNCDKGHFDSMYLYSMLFFQRKKNSINQREAVNFIRIAANNEQVESMFYYGNMLSNGNYVLVNKRKAIKYYKKAINKGNSDAMFDYANMLFYGDSISINKEEAIKYYKMSALKGNSNSIFKLLELMNKGIQVNLSEKETIIILKEAADNGDTESMVKYADILNTENGNHSNKKEAVEYYNLAINKGSIDAMLKCGLILIKGDGVPIDAKKGIQYIKFAADNGVNNAKEILNQVKREKTIPLMYKMNKIGVHSQTQFFQRKSEPSNKE